MDLADLPGGAGAPIDSIDDLVAAVAMLDRSRARVALGVAKVAASGLWAIDGSVSIKSWLQQHCRLSSLDAHRLVDDGRFLAAHDSVASAAITGRISGSQVGVLRSVVTRSTAQLFDEHQGVIVEQIEGMDVADTIKVAQRWKVCAEAVADMPEPKVPDRAWSSSRLADGTTVGRFVFDAVASEQIETAIETARSYDGDSDTRTHAMRAADAVASVFAFFNANHESEGTPRHRPHVELHFEADAHGDPAGDAITTSGRMLPDWARDMFACDCVIHRVLRSGSAVLDYGRSTRRVLIDLLRAVSCRDGGCRFPGCDRRQAWCEAHHIRFWRNGGETKLDNLMLLCNHHHQLIHRESWVVHMDPDGGALFATPDGRSLGSQPRGHPQQRRPTAA